MSLGEPLSPPLLTSRPHLQLHLVITGDDGTVESSAVCQHTPTVTPAPLARTGALLPLRVVQLIHLSGRLEQVWGSATPSHYSLCSAESWEKLRLCFGSLRLP